jgi:adenosylcobinamide kinase/adenosylcobinamide-phosphate guanylyltransferase
MRLILVTGGARSGKSAYAQRRSLELGGDDVTVIATARPCDEEMARRIARHRAARPAHWRTVEVPTNASVAVQAAATGVILLDCITVLLANVLLEAEAGDEEAALAAMATETSALLEAAAAREGTLIAVTNEVGLGIVPDGKLGRWFRDGLGIANQRLAGAAQEVVLLVCGLPMPLKPRVGGAMHTRVRFEPDDT